MDDQPTQDADVAPEPANLIDSARDALDSALRVAESTFALLRAELGVARSSAFSLMVLTLALMFLGVGAWLFISAAIAAGVYQLTGNLFIGIGSVALLNIIGAVIVQSSMRRCLRDLSLPRTRRLLARAREKSP